MVWCHAVAKSRNLDPTDEFVLVTQRSLWQQKKFVLVTQWHNFGDTTAQFWYHSGWTDIVVAKSAGRNGDSDGSLYLLASGFLYLLANGSLYLVALRRQHPCGLL